MSTSLIKFAPNQLPRGAWLRPLQDELVAAWRRGRRVFVEDFTAQLRHGKATEDDYLTLLVSEIEVRREVGEKLKHDDYCSRFPRLASALTVYFEESVTQLVLSNRFDVAKTTPTKPNCVNITGYELLEVLGRGGMGIVYKARQLGLNRLVALKMVLTGRFAGDDELARFRREAEAVAALDHPNIVRVYEVGEHEGTPFITFEYVNGGTLASVLAKCALLPDDAALIAEAIARAAHQAHTQGIVHRDLKPANILLETRSERSSTHTSNAATTQPSLPQASIGIPKITDFGIAKRLNETYALTASGTAAGTPQYMAPEQATGKKDQPINGQADVYAIGVILYEMLTRHTPFEGDNPVEVVQRACKQAPPPPTRYNPAIPRDLETIILKCLEKEPARRYPTALILAEELGRWSSGKPILARPIGVLEQGLRWCRRNRLVAGLLFGLFFVLFTGAVVSTSLAIAAHDAAADARHETAMAAVAQASSRRNAEIAEQNAREAKSQALRANWHAAAAGVRAKEAKELQLAEAQLKAEATKREALRAKELYAADMLVAFDDWHAGNVVNTQRLLDKYRPKTFDTPDPRGFEWHYIRNLGMQSSLIFSQSVMQHCAAVPNSTAWAVGGRNEYGQNEVAICDPPTCRVLEQLRVDSRCTVQNLAYAPNGAYLACLTNGPELVLLDTGTKKTKHRLVLSQRAERYPTRAVFSPDSKKLYVAVGSHKALHAPGMVIEYEVATGAEVRRLDGIQSAVLGVALSPDGKALVAVEHAGIVHRWEVATGEVAHTYTFPDGVAATQVAYSTQGDLLAVGTGRGSIAILDGRDLKLLHELRGHVDAVTQLAFAKEGTMLASAAGGNLVHVWDARTGEELRRCYGHKNHVTGLAFGAKSNDLVSVGKDNRALMWDVMHNAAVTTVEPVGEKTLRVLPMPAKDEVLLVTTWGSYQVLNLRTKKTVAMRYLGNLVSSAIDGCVTADGLTLALCTTDAGLMLVSLKEPNAPPKIIALDGAKPLHAAFAPDGKTLVVATTDGRLLAYSTTDYAKPRTLARFRESLRCVTFPPKDSTQFLTTGLDGTVRLWHTSTGDEVLTIQLEKQVLPETATFAPDGTTFAIAASDGVVQLRSATTGRILQRFRGHSSRTNRLSFDTRGRRLVTSSDDTTLRVWDVETGMTTLTLHGHTRSVHDAIFSADDRQIISVGEGPVKIWDASASHNDDDGRYLVAHTRLLDAQATYSPDGLVTATCQITNPSGLDLRVPLAPFKGYGIFVEVCVERLGDDPTIPSYGRTEEMDRYRLSFTRVLPSDRIMRNHHQFEVKVYANAKDWPPGKYRLNWQHSWPGEPINDKGTTSCIVIVPEPKR